MDFKQLAKIENESERVNRTYDIFNEDSRLNHSKAARVEFLTTVHYIEKYLKEGDKILDIGAGAGEYSLYFARKGYEVSALELADANIAAFEKKLTPEDKIDLVQGNALDLSRYAAKSFDIVLLFGPLYHLKNDADKQKCICEAKRVCKDGGKIFFAFISNDFVILTEFEYDVNYFSSDDYDKETFKLNDFPFVFHTVGAARKLLADGGVNILHEVASDGASELLAAKINEMNDEDYAQYLRYHFYICEKPELLGMTNHLLFVGEKMSKIQRGNLTIRQAEVTDAKQLAAWWNDGAVMAHAGFPNGLGTTEEEVIAGLGKGRMVIEESNRLIGECNYRNVADGVAEIGIKICETDCQNRGVGRKVLSMLISWLFKNRYSKIVLNTSLTNTRAQHVYESLGFCKVRTNIDSWKDQLDCLQSSVDYELVEKDFNSYI